MSAQRPDAEPETDIAHAYDKDNNVTQTTDEAANVFACAFDGLNRKTNCTITRAAGFIGTTSQTWQYDGLDVFMLPGLDPEQPKYQWVVNIAGNTWDGKGAKYASRIADWEPRGIQCKVRRDTGYWIVEAAIPFAAMPGSAKYSLWRFNINRNRPQREGLERKTEYGSWTDLKSFSPHTPERYGVIAIEALGGKLPR